MSGAQRQRDGSSAITPRSRGGARLIISRWLAVYVRTWRLPKRPTAVAGPLIFLVWCALDIMIMPGRS